MAPIFGLGPKQLELRLSCADFWFGHPSKRTKGSFFHGCAALMFKILKFSVDVTRVRHINPGKE
jgi:hypothetical protein